MTEQNSKNLLKLISSCDFLGQEVIEKWEKSVEKMPANFYPLVYRTFEEAKRKMDSLYAQFELNRDKNGGYKSLIQQKSSKAIELVKSLKLQSISGLIGL